VKDKQNVEAALRILQKEVRVCMEAWNAEETVSTRIYLKMGQYILRAYTERDLSVQERAMFAWTPVAFLRYWKAWLVISRFPIEKITLFLFKDIKHIFISIAGPHAQVVNKPLTRLVQRNESSFISLLYALRTSSIKYL